MQFLNVKTGEIIDIEANEMRKKRNLAYYSSAVSTISKKSELSIFLTLTIDIGRIPENVCPYKTIKELFRYFVKVQRRAGNKLSYVAVTETARSNYVHMHVIASDMSDPVECWRQIVSYIGGEANAQRIKSKVKTAKYIFKQLLQGTERSNTGKRFHSSRDISLTPDTKSSQGDWILLDSKSGGGYRKRKRDYYCVHGYEIDATKQFIKIVINHFNKYYGHLWPANEHKNEQKQVKKAKKGGVRTNTKPHFSLFLIDQEQQVNINSTTQGVIVRPAINQIDQEPVGIRL